MRPSLPAAIISLSSSGRRVVVLAAGGVELLADRDRDVDADEVEELERPHRLAGALRHAGVDLGGLEAELVEQPDGVEEVGEEEAVDDEPGLVGDLDHVLAEREAEGSGPVGDPVVERLREGRARSAPSG